MAVLIAFLGNPGSTYKKTRHNYGRLVCSDFEKSFPDLSWRKKFNAIFTELKVGEKARILILCPDQYMNKSGISVAACVKFFSIPVEKVLVVHDDLETPFGSYVFQRGGGLAGHNGLRSISGSLGSNDFYRLKMGIGRPVRESVSSYVLNRFSPLEESQLPACIESAAGFLYQILLTENLGTQPPGRITVFTS
ncbi:MAG: aminoacyl-tRNA hydrolase [Spirochaetes bacterium]|nr:aminoacyl-tRNA hydrolase [Spirochaetota bacterium]MBL7005687.1 aminoacyl-tRNA hydrolase [Spirochaetia bacterium]